MLNKELCLHTTRKARKAILLQALLGTDPRKRDLLLEPGPEHTSPEVCVSVLQFTEPQREVCSGARWAGQAGLEL